MAEYKYQPIDLDTSGVCLLQLFRGNFVAEVRCDLFEGWISQARDGFPYEVLSYTWGSTEKTAQITVNGSPMRVTSSLYTALQYLRLEDEDRVMWIDAICIDQENLEERRHQVQHMSDIYKEAEQVIVWLGEGTGETDLVMDLMKGLQGDHIKVEGDWRRLAPLWIGQGDIEQKTSIWLEGMKAMLSRPWFWRIWILQEIANARVATIHCGTKSVSARIFAQFPSIIGLEPNSHCQAVLDIMPGLSRKESWWGQDRNLHNLLMKFRKSEATDQRDVIYALLGISLDACQSDILIPDYTKSLHERESVIYHSFPWTLTDFLSNLDFLSSKLFEKACDVGHAALVEFLLAADDKIDLYITDSQDQTLLHRAACNEDETVVRLLLATGHFVIDATALDGKTPLSKAAQYGNWTTVQLLLENGAKRELKDTNGRTPLSYAAGYGYQSIVQLLLENGAEIETRDIIGRTPLSYAAENEDVAIVRLLLDNGAQIESRSDAGRTPLSYAKQNLGVTMATFQLLLENGADTTSPDAWKPALENRKGASLASHDSWTVSPEVLEQMKEHVKEEFED